MYTSIRTTARKDGGGIWEVLNACKEDTYIANSVSSKYSTEESEYSTEDTCIATKVGKDESEKRRE
jgi:hypothetical protein